MEALSDTDPCVAVSNMHTHMLSIANMHDFVSLFSSCWVRPFGRRQVMEQHLMADLAQEGQQQMVDPVQEVGRPLMQQFDEVAGVDSPQKQMEQLVPGTIYSLAAQRLAAVFP